MESARVDRWLWAVRLAKTRSVAAARCKGGHVEVNGRQAKPSTTVSVGDRVSARVNQRQRIVVVTQLIEKRVGAKLAEGCYDDHSPAPPPRDARVVGGPVATREPGAGRPTKRDRRQLDQWRQRNR